MIKNFLFISLILILFSGCAASSANVTVVDNTLHSSRPELNIKVNPDFKYIEVPEKSGFSQDADGGERYIAHSEGSYLFINLKDLRFIKISFQELPNSRTYFKAVSFDHIENRLDLGAEKLGGKDYNYCVFVAKDPSGTCQMVKILARTPSPQSRVVILYVENIYKCENWETVTLLNESQKNILSNFIDRSKKNIQFTDDRQE